MSKIHLLSISIIIMFSGALLALQKIPPNRYFGFRTALSYQSDAMWYKVNGLFGLLCILLSIIAIIIVLINPTWLHSYRWLPLITVLMPVFIAGLLCYALIS